jgi:hypothetical protein
MTHKTAKSVSARLEALQAARRKYVPTVSRYDKIWQFKYELQIFCILYMKFEYCD